MTTINWQEWLPAPRAASKQVIFPTHQRGNLMTWWMPFDKVWSPTRSKAEAYLYFLSILPGCDVILQTGESRKNCLSINQLSEGS